MPPRNDLETLNITMKGNEKDNETNAPDDDDSLQNSVPLRRSLSAPPLSNEKRKPHRRVLDQHYVIDKENRILMPGVPIQDDDFARDLHDFFNLIFLVPIVVLNWMNWNWDKYLAGKSDLQHSWTGEYYEVFFNTTIIYFVLDLLWVSLIPKCVKSPSTIIQHHIAAIFYLMIPLLIPKVRWMMGFAMSVEINTWFLIARRVFNKQGFSPWTIDLPYLFSVKVKMISILFYITWVLTRCVAYPYMLFRLYDEYKLHSKQVKSTINLMLCALCLHTVFCYLNAKWTFALISSKWRQYKLGGKTKMEKGL